MKHRRAAHRLIPMPWMRLLISAWPTLLWLVAQHRFVMLSKDVTSDAPHSTAPADSTFSYRDGSYFLDTNDPVKICGISVMLGDYEKTVKEPLVPLSPSFPLFLVTDQEHHIQNNNKNNTAWTRIPVDSSLWQDDCKEEEFVGARNNPCDQPFRFNIAKFYKMQPHRVPEIRDAGCNVVIWLDGTIQIKEAMFMGRMADRAARGQNFVVYVQDGRPTIKMGWRDGTVATEVGRSLFGKYGGKQGDAFGPPQHVQEQYDFYVKTGFREKWFQNESWFDQYKGVDENYNKYGLYITCMVMFDLRREETKTFLDCWWRENILRSTQDQVGFPFCAWKHRDILRIHALPDAEDPGSWPEGWAGNNANFHKLEHGV